MYPVVAALIALGVSDARLQIWIAERGEGCQRMKQVASLGM
jgi:hypothetical protein